MSGFFSDDEVKNRHADDDWNQKDLDWFFDTYLAAGPGATPNQMAQKLGRNPKALKRLKEQFTNNERDRVGQYVPGQRISRKGKKFTQNEITIWKAHVAKGVPAKETARLFCRDVQELSGKARDEVSAAKARTPFAPTLDMIWACRYIYFVWKKPILSDEAYDDLVKEEVDYGGGATAFMKIKNHRGWPKHIISLALYLAEKVEGETK